MPLAQFEEARRLLAARPAIGSFHGPRSAQAVRRAEEMLGLPFPPTYKLFLESYGCGNIGADEIYGLVNEDASGSGIPSVVWITREERREGLPHTHVVIGFSGDGLWYCIDTSRVDADGESPIAQFSPALPLATLDDLAPDFGTYFLECVQHGLL